MEFCLDNNLKTCLCNCSVRNTFIAFFLKIEDYFWFNIV